MDSEREGATTSTVCSLIGTWVDSPGAGGASLDCVSWSSMDVGVVSGASLSVKSVSLGAKGASLGVGAVSLGARGSSLGAVDASLSGAKGVLPGAVGESLLGAKVVSLVFGGASLGARGSSLGAVGASILGETGASEGAVSASLGASLGVDGLSALRVVIAPLGSSLGCSSKDSGTVTLGTTVSLPFSSVSLSISLLKEPGMDLRRVVLKSSTSSKNS